MIESSVITPDRSPPYAVREMSNAAGATVYHVVASDGISIVATCYRKDEAHKLAAAPALLEACRRAQLRICSDICPGEHCEECKALLAAIAKADGVAHVG